MNYEFCDDLDAPEMCVIMNHAWWANYHKEILEWKACSFGATSMMLFIKDPVDRTYFMLRWPQ
jgi:hypothetical protein